MRKRKAGKKEPEKKEEDEKEREREILIHMPVQNLKQLKGTRQLYWGGQWACFKFNDPKKILKHKM